MSDWQERLSEAMEARGISGGELARRTGFTAQYINSMRSKERGGRLTHDTAQRLAQALGVTVEWLTAGTGRRERLSDVYPIYVEGPPESASLFERYPSRAEIIALFGAKLEPEVIAALRVARPPDPEVDPGRDYWFEHTRCLMIDRERIKADPLFSSERSQSESPPPATQGKRLHDKLPPTTRSQPLSDGLPPATPRKKRNR